MAAFTVSSRDPISDPAPPAGRAATTPGAVTVVGEALIDLVADDTGTRFAAHPGGSPYNVAIGLARLGVATSLMARLGDNGFGRRLRERAEAEGVDLAAAPLAPELTTLAVVTLDDQARASYDFYVQGTADWQWTPEELERLPPRTDILHFGSLASWTAPGDVRIAQLVTRVRETVLVSYDPNVRPLLQRDPAAARERVQRSVALAHLVKASTEDVAWLYPRTPVPDVAARWLALGPRAVVFTDGPHGAHAYRACAAPLQRPGAAVNVVDTVGAGDSFTAAMLASCLRRGIRSAAALAGASSDVIKAILDDAIAASAITCQRAGADPPTAAEVAGAARVAAN